VEVPARGSPCAWKSLRVDGPEPPASGGSLFDSGKAKSLAHSPFTFFAVPYAPGTLKAAGHLGGRATATDTVFVRAFVDAAKATVGNDCWVGLDLGGPKTITKTCVSPRRAWTRRMTGGRFQGSDASDFHRGVKDLTALLPEPKDGQWAEITDIASARPFRYVRFLSPDDGWNNVAEIEFYTSPSPGPRSPR